MGELIKTLTSEPTTSTINNILNGATVHTNYDKWISYTDGLCSPQNMIDWGWRFIIGSALQRRVWFGPDHKKLFPNNYGILFGPPGVGKSLVLDVMNDFMKYHKKKDFHINKDNATSAEKVVIQSVEESNIKMAESSMVKSKLNLQDDPPLFPYCPDATTFEALVEHMGKCFRRINYTKTLPDGTNKLAIYGHCSMYANLDEVGSLLKKKAESVITYLLGLHGCPDLYEYKTKNSGEDRVINGCLNFIAGATPETMEELSNDKLIGSGFAARVIFVCANKNRKNVSKIPNLTPEQAQYRLDLLAHIKSLAGLYGPVVIDERTERFVDDWWNESENNRHNRPNRSSKLDGYYARKIIHFYKTLMCNHFGETTDMNIEYWEAEKALNDLNKEEPTMHLALSFDKTNPLAKLTDKVYNDIVKFKKRTMVDLISDYWDNLPMGNRSMDEVIAHLIAMDKIEQKVEETGQVIYIEKL